VTSSPAASSPGNDGAPFDLPGGPDAALFLHGLTGSPFELRPVAERLHRDGLRCLGPAMAGHGGDPRDLAGLSWRAWVDAAKRDLVRLAGARRTYVVGCSMGALVACALAHDLPGRVDGLALLAPALRLAPLLGLVGRLARRTPLGAVVVRKGGSDVRDAEMRRRNPTLPAVPLSAVGELLELQRHVDRLLPGVVAPALVLHGARDHTVTLGGARRLARRLGSGRGRVVVLAGSYHLLGIDVERERVAEEVAAFLRGLRPAGGAGEVPGAPQGEAPPAGLRTT
jgi:carboxylesterase